MASSDTERLEALGMLSVYCRSASNLLAADSNGLSDPYLICKTLGQAQRTHVVRKSLNPTWGVTLDFIGCLSDAVSGGLQIEAKDHDTFGKDDPLGAVTVDLGPLMGIDQLHVCQPLPKQGAVNLTVSWLELPPWMLESGVLTVTLEGGVNLLSADSNGYSDPYVKLSLCGQKHKSKHVAKTLNPTWGEHFEFKGTLRELTAAPLHLEAYDYDRFSKADPLGSADVPLGALEVVDMKSFRVALDTQGHVMLSVRWSADAAKSRRAQEEPESSGGVRSSARGGGDESELTLIEQGRLRMRVGAFGLWQERWFELSEEDLTYYASHLDAQPKGVLPLSCLTSIVASPSDGRRLTLRVSAADMDLTKTRAESSLSRASGRLPAVGGGGGRAPNRSPTTKSIELAAPDVVERDRWARILKLLAADGSSLGGHRRLDGTHHPSWAPRGPHAHQPWAAGGPHAHQPRVLCDHCLAGGSSTDGSSRGSFGYPLESVSKTPVGDSGLRVPSVLVHLWEALLKRQADGLDSEGIFRLSASADEVARVKAALEAAGASSDAGAALASLTGASGQCLAALIKAYLRELPGAPDAPFRSQPRTGLSALIATLDSQANGTATSPTPHPSLGTHQPPPTTHPLVHPPTTHHPLGHQPLSQPHPLGR